MNELTQKMYQSNTKKYSLIDKVIFFLLSSYFITFPFYLWDSGVPQIADFIMIILLSTYLYKTKGKVTFTVNAKPFIRINFLFVTYTVFINIMWMFLLENLSFFSKPMFYIYNFFIVLLIISLYTNYGAKIFQVIYNSIVISVLSQTIIIFVNGGFTGGRMVGSFNNPNQLGYYALLSTSILIILSNKLEIKPLWFIVTYFSNALLIIASLSSTTIASYLFLTVIFVFTKIENKKVKKRFVLTLVLILILIFIIKQRTNFFETSLMIEGLQTRGATVESKTSGIIEQRGYNRITDYPEYWIFGAGEGSYLQRFGSRVEFHSLLGNIQVSYGVIGLFIFLRLLYLTIKKNFFNKWYILMTVVFYGITHNGIRSGLLWILFGLMVI